MTKELQEHLTKELAEAVEAQDAARITRVHARISIAMIDCQCKTSERVKSLESKWNEIEARLRGAKMITNAVRYLCSAGLGAVVFKILSGGR